MKVRKVTSAAVAITAMLALAACGSSSAGSSSASAGSSTASAGGSSGSASSSSASASGLGSGNPVTIGIIQPYTGDSAYYGQYANEAFKLAMSKYGSTPGGHTIKFVRGDSKCTPTDAVQAVHPILSSQPVAVLDPACSGDTLAIEPALQAQGIASCSINLAPSITHPGGDVVRVAPSDAATNKLFAKYIASKGVKKIGIIGDTSGYGEGNTSTLASALKANGVQVVVNATYDFSATDYSGQILKLKQAGVDAAYFEGYDLEVGQLVKQAKQLQLNVPYFANTNAGNETAGKAAGSALNGVLFATAFLPDASPAMKSLTTTWQSTFHQAPNADSVDLYQCAVTLLKAIGAAGSNATAQSVNQAVKKVAAPGVTVGTISFGSSGDLTDPPVLIGTWRGGKTALVTRLAGQP
jgi:branched-chain amino acid transport system substrate-binding protein